MWVKSRPRSKAQIFKRERCIVAEIREKGYSENSFFRIQMAPMQTECSAMLFEFEAVERRAVMAGFDGGDITSNAGALSLLGQVDRL